MTDSTWDLVEDVREIVCLFALVSISGRPSGVVSCNNNICLPPTPFVAYIPRGNRFLSAVLY